MSFPTHTSFSSRLPDRTTQSQYPSQAPASTFQRSAPAFARREQVDSQTQSQQPAPTGPSYAYQNAPAAQYNTYTRGPRPAVTTQYAPPAADKNDILHELSDEQKEEINDAFSLFDVDKDRHLDYHELRVALRALGFTLSKPDTLTLMSQYGVPRPQPPSRPHAHQQPPHPSQLLVPQHSFTRIAGQRVLDRDPREEVERAFYLFDIDRKEYISLDDLRRVTRELGETSLDDAELAQMVEEFDYEGIGGVSRDAFFGICLA